MINYIIISRVLSPMSEEATELWKLYPEATGLSHKIEETNITLVNGEKLNEEIWSKIINPNLKKLGVTDKKTFINQRELDITKNQDDHTYIYIHFSGHNEKEIDIPVRKLESCLDFENITIIPFTVAATSWGKLERADNIYPLVIRKAEAELKTIATNYKARKEEGVFSWLEKYEELVLRSAKFSREWYEYITYREANFQNINLEFIKLKTDFKKEQVKLPEIKDAIGKLTYKIGTWDSKSNSPKAAKMTDFKQFRDNLVNYYKNEVNIAYPREENFDGWLIVHTLESLQKTTYLAPIDDLGSWFIKNPKPVLSIGLLPLWGNSQKTGCEVFRKEYLDARIRFWDSCVWFRYVPLLDENWVITQKTTFINVLNDIHTYHKNGIYNTISSREFLEFHLRVYKNAFVSGVTNQVARAHGGSVTPFSFHSETKIQQETTELIGKLEGLQWRVLLIDDYGESHLQTVKDVKTSDKNSSKGTNTEESSNSKAKRALMKQEFVKEALKNNTFIDLYPVADFDEAKKCIKNQDKHFDIILLDYLFQKKGKNEFGINFLKQLLKGQNEEEIDYLEDIYLGPLNKHWIVPISVYQNALTDNLHDAGIMTHGNKWLITQGTDPLNKPYLFRYVLLKLMEKQYNEVFITADLLPKFKNQKSSELMDNARKAYTKIIEVGSQLKGLIEFQEKSQFAKTLFLKRLDFLENPKDLVHVGEHLQHLFIMITNGNTQYKSQMWDEYFWLKDRLKISGLDTENYKFWRNIEKYIKKLTG